MPAALSQFKDYIEKVEEEIRMGMNYNPNIVTYYTGGGQPVVRPAVQSYPFSTEPEQIYEYYQVKEGIGTGLEDEVNKQVKEGYEVYKVVATSNGYLAYIMRRLVNVDPPPEPEPATPIYNDGVLEAPAEEVEPELPPVNRLAELDRITIELIKEQENGIYTGLEVLNILSNIRKLKWDEFENFIRGLERHEIADYRQFIKY